MHIKQAKALIFLASFAVIPSGAFFKKVAVQLLINEGLVERASPEGNLYHYKTTLPQSVDTALEVNEIMMRSDLLVQQGVSG